MGHRKYIYENERDVIENIIKTIKQVDGLVHQIWFDEDFTYRYKLTSAKNVIRIGHLDTLKYIEISRQAILNKEVVITFPWLSQFKQAAFFNKRLYHGFVLRK